MSISIDEDTGERVEEGKGIWTTILKLFDWVAFFLTGCLGKPNIF